MHATQISEKSPAEAHDVPAEAHDVEVVFSSSGDDVALDVSTLRLIGALQRKVFKRHRQVMKRRSIDTITMVPEPFAAIELDRPKVIVDFVGASGWDGRLAMLRAAESAVGASAVVRTRGWDSTEPGVLVDSRPVASAVFDIATMMSTHVEALRRGEQPFVFLVPEPDDMGAMKLWAELVTMAEDRLGIDRGTVRYSSRVVSR